MADNTDQLGALRFHNSNPVLSTGMSLRDYFAGQIIAGMVASPALLEAITASDIIKGQYEDKAAAFSYRWAAAMLKARQS